MKKAIKLFLPTAEAIERLLFPHAEVVVHDIKQNQIVAIYHPFSKRRVGDSSLFGPEEETAKLEECIGPYEKTNWDGRKLKSISSVIRDNKDNVVGMLCVNLDVSMFEKMKDFINVFMSDSHFTPQPDPLFNDDWQERVNCCVHQYLNERHLALDSLTRNERKKLVEHLYESGAFSVKNSASYIANILNISRATVYNYLSDKQQGKS